MNSAVKTVLLTVATLSLFVIALIEISGISQRALFNRYRPENPALNDAARASLQHIYQEDSARLAENKQRPKTTLSFKEQDVDLGTIKEGDTIHHTYIFTNTGNHPLIIADVRASCGCTIPSYSKEPVLPGQTGQVDIRFDSRNREGKQRKSIFITANTQPETTTLKFQAKVLSQK